MAEDAGQGRGGNRVCANLRPGSPTCSGAVGGAGSRAPRGIPEGKRGLAQAASGRLCVVLTSAIGLTRFAGVVCPGDGALTTTIVRTSTVVDHPSVASYSL
jgi:hypothetical protein